MLTTILIAIAVPAVVAGGLFAFRHRLPRLVADVRGIALQTVIIMVVLLAIAGAVAGVLLSRGDAASDQLESQDVGYFWTRYTDSAACDRAGYSYFGAGVSTVVTFGGATSTIGPSACGPS